uniref:Reverse transcriptase N-terminal domain-containing protein n=1 Tax=Dasyclonium flaccidum TaxID=2007274 RepID=A0A1Z1MKZ1_9FLOR|nr:hypothetical protein [Dasyclonium flaccidum]ARW66606.1 hypothetical protein [Dasyclonium flaccidum]
MIQKQIYLSARRYQLNYAYKLQNYLLNCHEAKIMSISKILEETYKYYNLYNKERYLTRNHSKLFLFKFLFNFKFCNINETINITENIKQNIVFLCLNPEWKAKLSQRMNKVFFNQFLNLRINIKDSITNKSLKYFNINRVLLKLKSNNYINKSIKNWLSMNCCIDLNKIYDLSYAIFIQKNKSGTFTNFNNLYLLLLNIALIDFHWYYFYLSKQILVINKAILKCLYSQVKLTQFINNYYFIYLIKHFLYSRYYSKLKIISSINKNYILLNINKLIKEYYNDYSDHISIIINEFVNEVINIKLYYWLRKQYKADFYFIYHKNFRTNNYILNYYIYNLNIEKKYISINYI